MDQERFGEGICAPGGKNEEFGVSGRTSVILGDFAALGRAERSSQE